MIEKRRELTRDQHRHGVELDKGEVGDNMPNLARHGDEEDGVELLREGS